MSQPALCPADHRDDKPRRAADGLLLCIWHRDRLERHLAELPALYVACEATLAGRSGTNTTGPVSGTAEPSWAVSDRPSAAREHVRVFLHGWVRVVLEEGPWQVAPADRIPALAAWLVARTDWLAAREWASEVALNAAETHSEARRAAYPEPVSRAKLGRCPEENCDGNLTAIVRRADSLLPTTVRCDVSDEHVWTADQWQALGRRMTGAGYHALARRIVQG